MNLIKLSFACLLAMTIFMVPVKLIQAADSAWLQTAMDGGLNQVGTTAFNTPNQPKDIRLITANLLNVFLGLLGTIFIVLMVVAGVIWMTSAGNADKVKKAISLMAMGAIGLLIVLASFAISVFITSRTIYSVGSEVNGRVDPNIKTNDRKAPNAPF